MKPSDALKSHRQDIRSIIEQCHARNPRVFGSVLHGNDTDDSDLDLLVDPTSETTLLDIARIQNRLQSLLGVPVDVLTPKALPERIRKEVLSEATYSTLSGTKTSLVPLFSILLTTPAVSMVSTILAARL